MAKLLLMIFPFAISLIKFVSMVSLLLHKICLSNFDLKSKLLLYWLIQVYLFLITQQAYVFYPFSILIFVALNLSCSFYYFIQIHHKDINYHQHLYKLICTML